MGSRRTMPRWIALAAFCAHALGCGSDSTSLRGGDGGGLGADATATDDAGPGGATDDSGGGIGTVDASLLPIVFGGTGGGTGSCLGLGAGCTTAGDCCSSDCVGGVCNYPACTSDRRMHDERGMLQPDLHGWNVRVAEHDVQDAWQRMRVGHRVLLEALLERDVPGLVLLWSGGGCVLDGIGLLHQLVHDRGGRDARHLRGQPAERAGQLRGRRWPDLRRVRHGRGCRAQWRRVACVRGSLLQPRVRALGPHRGARLSAGERLPRGG
jgi:hypothetical protein